MWAQTATPPIGLAGHPRRVTLEPGLVQPPSRSKGTGTAGINRPDELARRDRHESFATPYPIDPLPAPDGFRTARATRRPIIPLRLPDATISPALPKTGAAFSPFDFCNLEARLLLTRFPRRAAPEFAPTPTSLHTSHEFFPRGA